ncbi:MAG: flagellar biosynthetic protein FliQ [Deltaproteobacteria bacterium]|nr:MAG: flagellar biosynthetic protein FliQ [Deltaproteobacteria bacterium]
MTPEFVLEIVQRAVWVSVELAAPLLVVGVTVGLLMGLVQAATQISEPALTFVPKLAALGLTLAVTGPFLIDRMTTFGRAMFEAVATVGP